MIDRCRVVQESKCYFSSWGELEGTLLSKRSIKGCFFSRDDMMKHNSRVRGFLTTIVLKMNKEKGEQAGVETEGQGVWIDERPSSKTMLKECLFFSKPVLFFHGVVLL